MGIIIPNWRRWERSVAGSGDIERWIGVRCEGLWTRARRHEMPRDRRGRGARADVSTQLWG